MKPTSMRQDERKKKTRPSTFALPASLLAIASLAVACQGEISVPGAPSNNPDGPGSDAGAPTALPPEMKEEVGESGIRRLSAAEFNATVFDLVGVKVDGAATLPEDIRRPFDNEYVTQQSSEALVTSVDALAGEIATAVFNDTTLREAIVPCEPSGANDEDCFRQFVSSFGRLALRRPVTADEVDRFAVFMSHAQEDNDFWVAIDSALRAFLQHPEFLNRIEFGSAVQDSPSIFRLSDYELATRMSYLLWGSTPPAWLLDAVESGELATPEGVRANAVKLLDDPKAQRRLGRFHSMWLGYEQIPLAPSLAADLTQETQALINRVVFEEDRPWADLLRSTETYLTPALAEHYGLPQPSGEAGWVSYGNSGRQGLLSQGSFLSAVSKFGDTSPTQRGQLITRSLFCQPTYLPDPDLNINVDEPPETEDPNACKMERYNMWQVDGCKGCHLALEPIGFGLENFDAAGRFRAFEADRPDCPIDGKGSVPGIGDFSGPAELASLVAQSPDTSTCVGTQIYRFSVGRTELETEDHNLIERLVEESSVNGEVHLKTFILELVSSEAFRHRKEEAVQP